MNKATLKKAIKAMNQNIERAKFQLALTKEQMESTHTESDFAQYRYWEGQVAGLQQQLWLLEFLTGKEN